MPVSTEERPSRQTVLERAERRERIATTVLGDLWGSTIDMPHVTVELVAQEACDLADALMTELDRRRDAELAEAQR